MGNKLTLFFVFMMLFAFDLKAYVTKKQLKSYCTKELLNCEIEEENNTRKLCETASTYAGRCIYISRVSFDRTKGVACNNEAQKPDCTVKTKCSIEYLSYCKTDAECKTAGGYFKNGSCVTELVTKSCGKNATRNPNYKPEDDNSLPCVCKYDGSKLFDSNTSSGDCPTQEQADKEKTNKDKTLSEEKLKCESDPMSFWVEENKTCIHGSGKNKDEITKTADKANDIGIECLQEIRDQINKCKGDSTDAVNACNMKSQNNAEKTEKFSQFSQVVQQLTNAGTAEQCKNMGLVSAAASYGLSEIQTKCNDEMGKCQQSCNKEILKYKDSDVIVKACESNPRYNSKLVNPVDLDSEAKELAAVVEAAEKECITNTQFLLKDIGNALKSATNGYSTATQCENRFATNPILNPVDMNVCVANPNAAGCPVNCAANPRLAPCACLANPNGTGCKGAVSQVAGISNPNTNLPALGGLTTSTKLGSSGSGPSGGFDLNMDDASEKSALDQKPNKDESPSAGFAAAAAANAGGGGGTGSGGDGGGKGKNKTGGAEEDHSLFGGVFKTLKSAAGNLFGGGGSNAKKTNSNESRVNAAGLKPVVGNKALRGVASNGKSCFVDAKGAEFCFGKKNMDIFKMMNNQYNNQSNTLILDK